MTEEEYRKSWYKEEYYNSPTLPYSDKKEKLLSKIAGKGIIVLAILTPIIWIYLNFEEVYYKWIITSYKDKIEYHSREYNESKDELECYENQLKRKEEWKETNIWYCKKPWQW